MKEKILNVMNDRYEALDIIEINDAGRNFKDCIRVFNVPFNGTTERFPADNSLRRGFIEYINSGATFGSATGIILYDGIKKKIINKKNGFLPFFFI